MIGELTNGLCVYADIGSYSEHLRPRKVVTGARNREWRQPSRNACGLTFSRDERKGRGCGCARTGAPLNRSFCAGGFCAKFINAFGLGQQSGWQWKEQLAWMMVLWSRRLWAVELAARMRRLGRRRMGTPRTGPSWNGGLHRANVLRRFKKL